MEPSSKTGKKESKTEDISDEALFKLLAILAKTTINHDHNCPIHSNPEQLKVLMGKEAARNGDLESLKHFIDSSNVNKVSEKTTALDAALLFAFKNRDETKYFPILEYLLAQGASIQRPVPGTKVSAFGLATSIACLEDYTRPIEILLEKGARPFDSCTSDTTNAAMLCIVSKLRRDKGADSVLRIFQQKASTLQEAIECLSLDKTDQFANPTSIKQMAQNSSGALEKIFVAWTEGIKESLPIASILLKKGAHPHDELKGSLPGYTFLIAATTDALKRGETDLLELFLSANGNPRYKSFPMAPSAIEITKTVAVMEPENPHVAKVRALLNSHA